MPYVPDKYPPFKALNRLWASDIDLKFQLGPTNSKSNCDHLFDPESSLQVLSILQKLNVVL